MFCSFLCCAAVDVCVYCNCLCVLLLIFFCVLLLFIRLCYRSWQCYVHRSIQRNLICSNKASSKWDKKNNNLWLKQHEFHSHSKYQCVARNGNQKYMHRYLYQTTRAEKSRKKNRIYFLPSIDFFKWKFIEIKRKIHIHFANTSFWGIYNGLHIVHDSR